ncbi:amidase [Egicoccus sp. AB-alg6-2]|uniref:amidase n=1 Tax=Egicoccus sp. AB-alg6-2 TaxID=3242692 RepID=UPI00359D82D4
MPTEDPGRAHVGATAIEMAAAIHDGRVRARDLVAAHLDHLADVEPQLGAFVSVRRDLALDEADALDARADLDDLPLAGVPVAIKDVAHLAGEPSRFGSRASSAEPAPEDEAVVARIRAAGGIPIGKTRVPELSLWGTSDDRDGTAVSPWDPSRTAGGSSGGSAAAVAAGVVPLALGSDTFGSVRIPAAACGVFGLKPGRPLAPVEVAGERHGFGMSRYGPLATTVADAALLFDVVAGTDHLRVPTTEARPLHVAVSWAPPAPGVVIGRQWIEAAIEAGRLLRSVGHAVGHADPAYEPGTVPAVLSRWAGAAARDVELLRLEEAALQSRTRTHVALGRMLLERDAVKDAQAERWQDRLAELFDTYDVLVLPTLARDPLSARTWHTAGWAMNAVANLTAYPLTAAFNLADVPAAAVPLWHHNGRPLSVQVVAANGREDLVLAVAAELQRLRPWTRHAPGWGVPAS